MDETGGERDGDQEGSWFSTEVGDGCGGEEDVVVVKID